MYGDGVIRADLTGDCSTPCDGSGLIWSDFEALAKSVAATRVVDLKTAPVAVLYGTAAACAEGKDLAPDFTGGEPETPSK